MHFDSLRLLPGTPLQLAVDGDTNGRLPATLAGYLPGQAIMVNLGAQPELLERVNPRAIVEVHAYSEVHNCAVLFNVPVLGTSATPRPLLWLGFPAAVMRDESRRSERVATQLEARAKSAAGECDATLVDLSISGCCIELASDLGGVGDALSLSVAFPLPDQTRRVQVSAAIKVVLATPDHGEGVYRLGLAFDRLSDNGRALLQQSLETIRSRTEKA